jgi:RimJ/RimL family protein N-acetyltransferase
LAKAEVSMAFLREFQRNGEALELARMMIEFAFDRVNLDALFGCTPIRNRAAVVFTQKCGFRKIGVAPMYCSWHGEPCDALLTVLTRAQWQADLKGEG